MTQANTSSVTSTVRAIHDRVDAALERIATAIGCEPFDSALHRIGAAPGPDRDVVVGYDALLSELSRHLIGMQVAVLPVVADKLSVSDSGLREHLAEERRMERTMRRIERLLWGDARAPSRDLHRLHHELIAAMRDHRLREEAVLAHLEEALSPEQSAALAARLDAATAHAPTRTHPLATVRWTAARLLYRPVALWDRVLDVLNGRTVPRFGPPPPSRKPGRWGSYLTGNPLPAEDKPEKPAV